MIQSTVFVVFKKAKQSRDVISIHRRYENADRGVSRSVNQIKRTTRYIACGVRFRKLSPDACDEIREKFRAFKDKTVESIGPVRGESPSLCSK